MKMICYEIVMIRQKQNEELSSLMVKNIDKALVTYKNFKPLMKLTELIFSRSLILPCLTIRELYRAFNLFKSIIIIPKSLELKCDFIISFLPSSAFYED